MNGLDNLIAKANPKNPKTLRNLIEKQIKFNDTLKVNPLHVMKDIPQEWVTTRCAVPILIRIYKQYSDLFAGTSEINSDVEKVGSLFFSHQVFQGPINNSQTEAIAVASDLIGSYLNKYYNGKYATCDSDNNRVLFDRIEFLINKHNPSYGDFVVYGKLEPFKFPLLDKAKPNEIFYWSKKVAPESGISVKSVIFSRIDSIGETEKRKDFWRWLNPEEIPITKDVEIAVLEEFFKSIGVNNGR